MTWWRWLGLAACLSGTAVLVFMHPHGPRRGLRDVVSRLAIYAFGFVVVEPVLEIGGPLTLLVTLPLFAVADGFGRSPLGVLNFLVLQWFGVRLQRPTRLIDVVNPSPNRVMTHAEAMQRVEPWHRWRFLRWIWPLTGWWSAYRYIRRSSTL